MDTAALSLDTDSLCLMGVLSFLMPDNIPQDLFEPSDDKNFPEDLKFCSDGFSLAAVLRKLLTVALIKRDRDTRTITIHRMVQTQLKQYLSQHDRQRSFNNTVMLLYKAFPTEDLSTGQLYDRWTLCNQYLQHVLNLGGCFSEEIKRSQKFQAP